jgi:hypothetical protein
VPGLYSPQMKKKRFTKSMGMKTLRYKYLQLMVISSRQCCCLEASAYGWHYNQTSTHRVFLESVSCSRISVMEHEVHPCRHISLVLNCILSQRFITNLTICILMHCHFPICIFVSQRDSHRFHCRPLCMLKSRHLILLEL